MTCSEDTLSSILEQLPGDVARVDPTDRFPFGVDRFGKFERLSLWNVASNIEQNRNKSNPSV
jgi:hypothetical protein